MPIWRGNEGRTLSRSESQRAFGQVNDSKATSMSSPTAQKGLAQTSDRNLMRFVQGVALTPVGFLLLCALIPAHWIPASYGFGFSLLLMTVGFGILSALVRKHDISLPVSSRALFLIALAKLAVGSWYWHTYLYSLEDQAPRPAFVESEVYGERHADVDCLEEINRIWDKEGLHYITEDEAAISINNRPPAHIAALVIRAFGMQYAAFFPFVALLVAAGAIAITASMKSLGCDRERLAFGGWLAALWPYSWQVAGVSKDTMLSGVVALVAGLLTTGRANTVASNMSHGLAFLALPIFRPAYFLSSSVVALVSLLRRKSDVRKKLLAMVALGSVALAAFVFLNVGESVRSHAEWEANTSKLMNIPILGRLVFALGTPFPWTQGYEHWYNFPQLFLYAQQVVTASCLAAIGKMALLGRRRMLGSAAVLGLAMMLVGIGSPYTSGHYVQVSVIAMLPAAVLESGQGMKRYLVASTVLFLGGNVLWLLAR